jgi:predicted ester cyclase
MSMTNHDASRRAFLVRAAVGAGAVAGAGLVSDTHAENPKRDKKAKAEASAALNSVQIVESFWADVWAGRNPDAVDRYVVEDFVITSGGKEIRSRDSFKQWIREFQAKVADLEFEAIESFQNAEGSRVASRWRLRGRNNGIFGLPPDQRHLEMTGTAVWAVRADGKLLHNWVERNAWECYQRLTGVLSH